MPQGTQIQQYQRIEGKILPAQHASAALPTNCLSIAFQKTDKSGAFSTTTASSLTFYYLSNTAFILWIPLYNIVAHIFPTNLNYTR